MVVDSVFDPFDPFGAGSGNPSQEDAAGQITGLARSGDKKMVLITFVVDNSASMMGAPINALNNALLSTLQNLEDLEKDSSFVAADFKIAIMTFTSSAQWIMEPCSVKQALEQLPRIEVSVGNTYYSSVFKELNSALTKSRFFEEKGKKAKPIIIFMTDGAPHPIDKYEYDLKDLQKNGWYMCAYKSAILMGEAAEDPRAQEVCRQFVGEQGGVISTTQISEIISKISTQTIRTLMGMPADDERDRSSTPTPDPGPSPTPDPGPSPIPDQGPSPMPDPGPSPTPGPWSSPMSDPGPSPTPDPWSSPMPDPGPVPTPSQIPGPFNQSGPFGSVTNDSNNSTGQGNLSSPIDDVKINPAPSPF